MCRNSARLHEHTSVTRTQRIHVETEAAFRSRMLEALTVLFRCPFFPVIIDLTPRKSIIPRNRISEVVDLVTAFT
jgi:hypothetical protein